MRMIYKYKRIIVILISIFDLIIIPKFHGQTNCDSLFQDFRFHILVELEYNNGAIVWDDETTLSHCLVALNCTTQELQKFIFDTIPNIRCKIFNDLAQKTDDLTLLNQILQLHENDTLEYLLSRVSQGISYNVRECMQKTLDAKSKNELSSINYQRKINQIQNSPKLVIPGMEHSHIPLETLLSIDSLRCSIQEISIDSFTLHARKSMTSNNSHLTNQMKRQLKKMKSGDSIYFEEINVRMPDGTTRKMAPITLKIL